MFTFAANPTCSRKSISSLLVISSLLANTSSSSLSSFSDSFPPIQFLFSRFSSIFYYYFYLLKFGSSGLRNQRYVGQAQDRAVVECEGCVCHISLNLRCNSPVIGFHRASLKSLRVCKFTLLAFSIFVASQCSCEFFVLFSSSVFVVVDKFDFHIVFIASSRTECFRRYFARHHF